MAVKQKNLRTPPFHEMEVVGELEDPKEDETKAYLDWVGGGEFGAAGG